MNAEQPPFRRAWTTDGGGRIRLNARSYTSPSFASHDALDDPSRTSDYASNQPRRRSLFHTAFSLLGAVHELRRERVRQQELDEHTSPIHRRDTRRREASRSESADYARWERHDSQDRSRSARLNEQYVRPSGQPARERMSSSRLRRSSRWEDAPMDRDLPAAQNYDTEDDGARIRPKPMRIRALESDILYEQREIDECLQWLAVHAHRDETSDRMIQHMTTQLQLHRRQLKAAKADLRAELDRAERPRPESARRTSRRASTRDSDRGVEPEASPGFDNLFSFLMGGAAFSTSRNAQPSATHADMFNQLFADIAAQHPQFIFTTSQGPPNVAGGFPRDFFGAHFNDGAQEAGTSAQARPRPSRPTNLLSAQEAKALYQTYNDRWSVIAPSDPELPYPGRKLQSAALVDRATIWAPMVSSAVSTWSIEDVIRVNTQSFLLGVVDLTPNYTDRLSKIEVDFDHSKADPVQLQLLFDMLKKEKMRWHSDRLGRRNGGEAGVNEALQQSQVARGIFHAVCELSDLVATKR
ncbi:hypothetical protein AMS68_001549 [Peltaster fructicola]|uniref:Uncharacterized protein n=1 Tax=Peltaster fructicola TaxID=286661 RepID=A0A6H0XMP8_9PEZI|nr:hypothetical protein AMS68_001549 [Peltaster fructicola]